MALTDIHSTGSVGIYSSRNNDTGITSKVCFNDIPIRFICICCKIGLNMILLIKCVRRNTI